MIQKSMSLKYEPASEPLHIADRVRVLDRAEEPARKKRETRFASPKPSDEPRRERVLY